MRSSERRWVGSQPHAVTQPEARTVACSQGKRVPGSWSRAQKPRQEGRHQRRTKPACGDGAAGPPPPAAREGPLATRGWRQRQHNWKPGARDPRGGPGEGQASAALRQQGGKRETSPGPLSQAGEAEGPPGLWAADTGRVPEAWARDSPGSCPWDHEPRAGQSGLWVGRASVGGAYRASRVV